MPPAAFAAIAPTVTVAKADLTQQEPIEVRVNLGNAEGARVFDPPGITFETGKLYSSFCTIRARPSTISPHPGLADRVFTRKVHVMDAEGAKAVSEIKGTIREFEVFPGGTAEWWFVPVAAVGGTELYCHVKD